MTFVREKYEILKDLSVLILSGGKSKRFGKNKAFFKINGKHMIQHVFERVSKFTNEIVISCKDECDKLSKMFPNSKIVKDVVNETGPLVGLVSSLPHISSTYVAVITCDSPKINHLLIRALLDRARGHDGAVPMWPNGYLEPLQAVYDKERLRSVVENLYRKNEMKISKVIKNLKDIVYLPIDNLKVIDPKLESFLNANSPEDIYF